MKPKGLSCTLVVLLIALHFSVSTSQYAASFLRGYQGPVPQERQLLSPDVTLIKDEVVVLTDAIRNVIVSELWPGTGEDSD
jgi:hypothetical protein